MKKILLIVLVCLFALLSLGLGIYCIELKTKIEELESDNTITGNDIVNNDDTNNNENVEQINLDCSFTRTYEIVHLLEGYRAAGPDYSFVVIDQFQFFEPEVHNLPAKLKENLKVGEYYEFTYHLKGKMDASKDLDMDDINDMIVLEHPGDDNLTATLQIKKTDKLGLGQIQEPICKTTK